MTQINYINFDRLKYVAKWAGYIGAFQAIIWIALAFIGITSYYCVFDYSSDRATVNSTTYGHVIAWSFYHFYFKGECEIKNLPYINSSSVDTTKLSLQTSQTNIFVWVYMVLSFLWFCSSISLLTYMKKDKLKKTLILLNIWIFICFAISILDLALGIIFGIDYNYFHLASYEKPLTETTENVDSYGVLIVAGQIVSFSLMLIALRGFILWIINVCFVVYFARETLVINELDSDETNFIHKEFSSDSHSINSRPPINAFDTRNDAISIHPQNENVTENNNENLNAKPTEQALTIDNSNAIQRASLISNELLKERQSKFAQYEQYPPTVIKPEIAKKPQRVEPFNYFNGNKRVTDPRFPEPDYSPVVPRKLYPVSKRSFR